MIVKKHVTAGRLVLAVCDSDILGKVFTEGDAVLDLSGEFYRGDEASREEVEKLMSRAYMINAAGESSVECARGLGLAGKTSIISGIPYAQALVVRE